MTTKTKLSKIKQRYSQQYKTESLALAEKVGAPTAVKQLELHESQLHTVFEYIEVDYNRNRRHSANGCISPMAFEAL